MPSASEADTVGTTGVAGTVAVGGTTTDVGAVGGVTAARRGRHDQRGHHAWARKETHRAIVTLAPATICRTPGPSSGG